MMEQLTRKQAIAMYESGLWQEWSLEYIAKLQLYNDRLCVPFDLFHQAITQELGRSVWTHEFADLDRLKSEYEGLKPKPTMQEIIELIPEEKRIILTAGIE